MEIQSDEENTFVAGMLNEDKNLWIGYNDNQTEGHWVWTNTGKHGSFTKWSPGEPNNAGPESGGQDCAVIQKKKKVTTWDDQGCENGEYFVCEKGVSEFKLHVYSIGSSLGTFVSPC